MAFRDEEVALRSRLDALEAENRRLVEELAARRGARRKGRGNVLCVWILLGSSVLLGAASWYSAYEIGGREQEIAGGVLASLGGCALVLAVLLVLLPRVLGVVRPGEAVVVSGRSYVGADGTRRGFRVVVGGRVVHMPLIERVDRMDLTPISLDLTLRAVPIRRAEIDIVLRGSAKIPATEPYITHAVERFLGKSQEDIRAAVTETLTGAARGVLTQLTADEVREDGFKVVEHIRAEAEGDLRTIGIEVERLHIIDLQIRA